MNQGLNSLDQFEQTSTQDIFMSNFLNEEIREGQSGINFEAQSEVSQAPFASTQNECLVKPTEYYARDPANEKKTKFE